MISKFIKIAVVGEDEVGNNALIDQLNPSRPTKHSEIGAYFAIKIMELLTPTGKINIKAQFWILRPGERFASVRSLYFAGSHGVFIIYNVNDRKSYNNVPRWVDQLAKCTRKQKPVVFLVGNKIELRSQDDPDHITHEEGLEMAAQISQSVHSMEGEVQFFKISTNAGEEEVTVDILFRRIVEQIYNKFKNHSEEKDPTVIIPVEIRTSFGEPPQPEEPLIIDDSDLDWRKTLEERDGD